MKVRDPRVLYRLAPGSEGAWNGTHVRVNAAGLRGRDYPVPRRDSGTRILLLGDSVVFGAGLPEEETIAAHLEGLIPGAEVINGGIFGYNAVQEVSLLEEIAPLYRPDVVIAGFVHNDIDNWGLGDGGAVPPIASSRFDPPPRAAWSTRLADLMLPESFDEERLNLLPAEAGGGARAWLAAHSRLYLFAYLRLRTHAWNLTSGERPEPALANPACRNDEVIWDPLRSRFDAMRRIASASGAKFAVVILAAQLWEGRPLAKLLDLLAQEGIPTLDLSPVWGDPGFYAREYTLGWDPHPNARATRLVAELLRDFLQNPFFTEGSASAPLPGPHDVIARRGELRERLASWRRRQEERVAQDAASWIAETARLSASPIPLQGSEDLGQVLYGFWPPDDSPAPALAPGPRVEGGLWMSRDGGVILGGSPEAGSVIVGVRLPAVSGAAGVMTVEIGSPPGRCSVARSTHRLAPDATGRVLVSVDLPESLRGAPIIEVTLRADRSVAASTPGAGDAPADPRRVSFLVERVALR